MSDYLASNEIQKSRFSMFDMANLTSRVGSIDGQTQFVHIGGPSAVGKTTLALILQSELPKSEVLSVDSYLIAGLGRKAGTFSDRPPDPSKPYIGGITPEVWEFPLLQRHIAKLKAQKAVKVPIFDQTVKDRVGYRDLQPAPQIILEGGHSFSEDLRDTADYKVLVSAPLHDRLVRKAVRTHGRYGRDDLDDVWGRYLTKDEPSWAYYRAEFSEIADQVFSNPSDPINDFKSLPTAKYKRADGVYHKLVPAAETGSLYDTEELGVIEASRGTFQLSYAVGGRDLVNLPLDRQYVELLADHYDFTRGEGDE